MFGEMPPVSDVVFSTSTKATPPKLEAHHLPLRAAPAGSSNYLLGTDQPDAQQKAQQWKGD